MFLEKIRGLNAWIFDIAFELSDPNRSAMF